MLMARLSGTRMEVATLGAVPVKKKEKKLRTVIQFVKVRRWCILLFAGTFDIRPAASYIV